MGMTVNGRRVGCVACGGTGLNSRGGNCAVCNGAGGGGKAYKQAVKAVEKAIATGKPVVVPPKVQKVTPVTRSGSKTGTPAIKAPSAAKDAKKASKAMDKAKKAADKLEEEETRRGNVIKESFREIYGKLGRCGDPLSLRMEELTEKLEGADKLAKVLQIAKDNGIDANARWGHLNTGMIRMNLGNVLRKMQTKGTTLVLK